jgi:primosomal protein N' (replication factor Y)
MTCPLLDTELMQTLAWAADYWLGAPGEAYANALPLALREPRSRCPPLATNTGR